MVWYGKILRLERFLIRCGRPFFDCAARTQQVSTLLTGKSLVSEDIPLIEAVCSQNVIPMEMGQDDAITGPAGIRKETLQIADLFPVIPGSIKNALSGLQIIPG